MILSVHVNKVCFYCMSSNGELLQKLINRCPSELSSFDKRKSMIISRFREKSVEFRLKYDVLSFRQIKTLIFAQWNLLVKFYFIKDFNFLGFVVVQNIVSLKHCHVLLKQPGESVLFSGKKIIYRTQTDDKLIDKDQF